jgi:hypothetical protein
LERESGERIGRSLLNVKDPFWRRRRLLPLLLSSKSLLQIPFTEKLGGKKFEELFKERVLVVIDEKP